MYQALTKYIGHFEDAGAWIIDRENDGSEEHPIQMPYLSYSQTITKFISEMDAFMVRNYRICGYSKLRPRSRKSSRTAGPSERLAARIEKHFAPVIDCGFFPVTGIDGSVLEAARPQIFVHHVRKQ